MQSLFLVCKSLKRFLTAYIQLPSIIRVAKRLNPAILDKINHNHAYRESGLDRLEQAVMEDIDLS